MSSDPINPKHYKHLPAEAIEIIDAAIEGAPSPQAAAAQSHLLGYALRANQKGQLAIDAGKAEWYAARWIKAIREAEAKAIPANETPSDEPTLQPSKTQPPKGYRFLTKQDFYAKLDEFINATGKREPVLEGLIGQRVDVNKPHSWIRRCEFDRGERVAIQFADGIYTVNGKEPGYIDCYSVQLDGFSPRRCWTVDAKNLIPLDTPVDKPTPWTPKVGERVVLKATGAIYRIESYNEYSKQYSMQGWPGSCVNLESIAPWFETAPPKRYRDPTLADLKNGPIDCEYRDNEGERWRSGLLVHILSGSMRFLCTDKEELLCGQWAQCQIEVAE